MVDHRCGLCGDQQLAVLGGRFQQVGKHGQGRRVKSQFRFVQDDQFRQVVFRLKQKREQGDSPERSVGQLVRAELVIRFLCPPVEGDVLRVQPQRFQDEILEKRATAFTAATIRRYAVG